MDDRLLEPEKAYAEHYKAQFEANAEEYFEDLLKRSGVDAEQNRKAAAKYRTLKTKEAHAKSMLSRKKALRVLLIVLCVIGFLCALIGVYALVKGLYLSGSLFSAFGLALAAGMILVIVLVMNKQIRRAQQIFLERQNAAGEAYAEAERQMAPLNALFDETAPRKLIQKTVPLLEIDDDFNIRRYDYLSGKYGFGENTDEASSTIGIMTGEILGNPFVVDRQLRRTMGMQRYTGSIVITWTTTSRDSKGHLQTHHHSQTLCASVDKPKPFYSKTTRLIYGNEAAPKLSFTHTPTHAEKYSEAQLQKKIKKGAKKLRSLQNKQMRNDTVNFTKMGNETFDVLFGATDRNNEVEFRLMFTPLAQKNMIDLITGGDSYGDDFTFRKSGCLNYISSEHSERFPFDIDYKQFRSYDVDISKQTFIRMNAEYFKMLFFDFAPLLAVPLYQQHKPHEYIYKDTYERNYTGYEAEYAANRLGERYFANEYSDTQSILKAQFLSGDGSTDKVKITAHSFHAESRTDFVPTLGGDGRVHAVPVHWMEYFPVERGSVVNLKRVGITEREFEAENEEGKLKQALFGLGAASSVSHGILCCLMHDESTPFDETLNRILNK